MNTIDAQQITGLILAGGRGTRMGQIDKGLQTFRNAPMALHALLRLNPQVGEVIINANQNLAAYESFGTQVWPDHLTGFAGPLAGLQTGLLHCNSPYLLTVPCDSPLLPHDLASRLSAGLLADDADLAVAVTLESEDGVTRRQMHPVFALVKTALLNDLSEFLRTGGRKVDAWFAPLRVAEVLFDDHTAFRNFNTLQELRQFE
ncbi:MULTISPECIES: molybdenum cofactor guanylyltransferase MobA [unclassified Undibacterium]|uniref:molybdenum cofactor guanylyltransferase MobA n=1 Tax=unclassified Undibacterium TaxID=2630295 RepID=UPI002AC8A7FF|nr:MULTISPECIES: molybdenum cofactor guanylyltransferase MobA [unclassified Undibacterium]MEB0138710.1 molybdenum cofactor guanylyltransferase MobA [Undibacterium sp. CCC2.1]MEB0171511.1 molybdenum cofactor guanylyltransferase MobA [Undibacterium sp. CCC1.1]MEB0175418.1 molybdenum cofactor guanylyltransferase MobA [Undibacterium sp. CCC3.4]MEB0214711.1 molybdenum cofactor guanylyltransferase MobA [Undibacterium sp. 5I2]WPX43330.1 molybdenum cofactor guanylyltransferase MobA [Undibacterium sp. 